MSEQHVIIIPSNNDDDFTITGDLFADLDHGEDGTDTDDDHDIVEVVPVPQACKHKEPSRTLAPAEVVTVALSGTGETAILSNNGMLALWRLCTDGNDQPAKVWTAPIKIPLTDEPLLRLRKKTHLSLSRGAQYVAVTYTYSDSRKYTFDILAVSTSESVPIFEKGKNCAAGFVGEDMLAVLYRNPRRIQLWDSRRWTIVAEHAWDFPSQWKWQTSDPFYQLSLLRRGFFLSSGNEELNIITLHSLQKGPTENLYYLDKNLKEVLIMDISADGMFLAIYARLTNAQSEISCYSVKSGVKFSSILTREVQKLCFLATNQLVTLVSTTYTVYDPFSLCPLHQFSEDSLHTFCFEDGSYIKFKDASPYSMPLPHTIYRLPASSSALETIYSAGIMDTMKSDNVEDMGFSHHCSTNGFCVLSTATNDKKGIDKIYNILRLIRGPTKWLESAGSRKRFLSIGHHTIALFGGSRNRPDLEWVWNAPFRTDDSTFTLELDCIKTIDLETTAGGDQLLHVTLSRESANKYIILELPDAENVTTTQEVAIVHNAVGFLALIARFADLPDRRVPLHETIGLILRYTNLYPDRNLLSVVGDHLPLGDFGRLGLNDILARLIDQEKQGKDSVWIPTHNSHGQSALSAIVLRRNTRSVSAIVNYCLEKALQPIPGQLGYMEIVVSCLPQLIEYHPDVVRTIAMRASYCSVQRGLSKGNQERWIVAHSNRKNFHPLSIEPIASNFSALFTGQFSWWTFTFKDRVEYHQAVLSVLPFPDMFVYPRPNFDPSKGLFDSQYLQYLWTIIFCPRSVFSTIALRKSIFSEPQLMYPIIFYKWEMFAGRIFMLILCLQIIKFILFSVAVISQYQGIYPVIVVITTVFLVQEIRQMAGQSSHYWISFYNFFDLASIGFPLAASILPLRGMAQPPWLNSFSVFFMWLHLLISLRVFRGIGVTAAILYKIVRKAAWLFLVLFAVVVSFAHALFLLLKDAEMTASPIALTGFLVSANAPSANISLVQTTDSATPNNAFTDFATALQNTYLFISGDYSTVSGYGMNLALIIFKCMFIFITTIILLNVLIALLNNVYTETAEQGERVWLDQMAGLIAEIEVYWMTPADRQNPKFFPKYIYYEAFLDKSSDWATYVKTAMSSKSDINAQDIREVIESVLAGFTATPSGTSTPNQATAPANVDSGSLHTIAASLGVEIERKMDEHVAAMRAEIADLKELLQEVLGKKG